MIVAYVFLRKYSVNNGVFLTQAARRIAPRFFPASPANRYTRGMAMFLGFGNISLLKE
jgi:hypothetical protein